MSVKVVCDYCGTWGYWDRCNCPNCGAPLPFSASDLRLVRAKYWGLPTVGAGTRVEVRQRGNEIQSVQVYEVRGE